MSLNHSYANGRIVGELLEMAVERVDFDAAWDMLRQSLLDFEMGSPEQAASWIAGISRLPAPFRAAMPSLAQLRELAEKAWSGRRD